MSFENGHFKELEFENVTKLCQFQIKFYDIYIYIYIVLRSLNYFKTIMN